jgi:hypothetical protein
MREYSRLVAVTLPDWPVRPQAESLRQWPTLVDLAGRVQQLPGFEAFVLIGSLAGGSPDLMSDIDSFALVANGSFGAAWDARTTLYECAAFAWDLRTDGEPEIGKHAWITYDLVLVECVITSRRGRPKLADPHVVLFGPAESTDAFERIPPIARTELAAYVSKLRNEGHEQPEVQQRYEELARTLRAVRP